MIVVLWFHQACAEHFTRDRNTLWTLTAFSIKQSLTSEPSGCSAKQLWQIAGWDMWMLNSQLLKIIPSETLVVWPVVVFHWSLATHFSTGKITPFPQPQIYQLSFLCVCLCHSGVHSLFLIERLYPQTDLGFILLLLFQVWRGLVSQKHLHVHTCSKCCHLSAKFPQMWAETITQLYTCRRGEGKNAKPCTEDNEAKKTGSCSKTSHIQTSDFPPCLSCCQQPAGCAEG